MDEKPPYPGPKETAHVFPEGYRGLSPTIDEREWNELMDTRRTTIINEGGAEAFEGDVMKINDQVYAKVITVENEGIRQKIEVELLGD
jgi:hypothetical protein